MAQRALQVCSNPPCPNLTPRGRCPSCKADARRTQARQRRAAGDPAMSVYSTQAWRQPARDWLEHNPTCIDCGHPSTQRDHTPPRRLLIAAGIHEPDHPRWWVPRCEPCHSRKTRTIDVPLLRRLDAGEPAQALCEEAMTMTQMGWGIPTRP